MFANSRFSFTTNSTKLEFIKKMTETEHLFGVLNDKIKFGDELIESLKPLEDIDGIKKLERKIQQEIGFLKRLQKTRKIKIEHLSCSNLRHLGAMVDCASRPGVIAVCKVFHLDQNTKLHIDIVGDNGKTWTKVIARNPKSLSALSSGKASYGARSILDQAKDYVDCARLNQCMYQSPKVVFELMSGIEEHLANKLKTIGVVVKGDVLPDSNTCDDDTTDSESYDDEDDEIICDSQILPEISNKEHPELDTLNLDVTTLMAYVSNMTNGHCNYVFKQHILTEQCEWEAQRPVKPIIEKLFEGKTLVCCRTAWDEFEKIVKNLGGTHELKRTDELKEKLTIYPDDYGGEDDCLRKNLAVRGHVRLRSKIIFNFGHRIKALTVSANEGFVRAALQQGVTYAAFIHESRALTEGKEASGQKRSLEEMSSIRNTVLR